MPAINMAGTMYNDSQHLTNVMVLSGDPKFLDPNAGKYLVQGLWHVPEITLEQTYNRLCPSLLNAISGSLISYSNTNTSPHIDDSYADSIIFHG